MGPQKKIFLVDDHPLVREWLSNLIGQQSGLVVCGEAETALEAFQNIVASKPDLAIVDLSLKDSSGLDLIEQINRHCPGIVTLVLSVHEEAHLAERALEAGARGYVTKGDTSGKVVSAILAVIGGETYISERLKAKLLAGSLQGSAKSATHSLSEREREVFKLLGQGCGTGHIAQVLELSVKTVETHFARIKQKLRLGSTLEVRLEAARQRGVVPPPVEPAPSVRRSH